MLTLEVVGLDPDQAQQLARRLRQAEADLQASSVRIQGLLDQAGDGCTAPAAARRAARTCGAQADELERRSGFVRAPAPVGRSWLWSPTPLGRDYSPGPPLPAPADGDCTAVSPMSIVMLGPATLVTPPAPLRTNPVAGMSIVGLPCRPSTEVAGPHLDADTPSPSEQPPPQPSGGIGDDDDEDPTVGEILQGKRGSIVRAPLPEGSPSWDDVRGMPMSEIRARARANEPGYRSIVKLLTDGRFNR